MKKGDIILMNVPFTDLSDKKIRPALILGKNQDDFIICFISSKANTYTEHDVRIKADVKNGLRADSIIKCPKLFTLHGSLIENELGAIDKKTYGSVVKKIIGIIR